MNSSKQSKPQKWDRKKLVGILESIATIAAALTSLVGVFTYLHKKAEQKRLDDLTHDEQILAKKIESAQSDTERELYAKKLFEIRSKR